MTERINEYKVEPSANGFWHLHRKRIRYRDFMGKKLVTPVEDWEYIDCYTSMREIKKAIAHLSTPTKYFQFGTV